MLRRTLVRPHRLPRQARRLATASTTPTPVSDTPPPPPDTTKPKVTRPRHAWGPRPLPAGFPVLPPTFGRNQMLAVPDSTRALLEEIVASFTAPVRYAFAYGSGVFDQHGYPRGGTGKERPMIDFLFAVTHPPHWHSVNLRQNPSHYPLHARALGSDFVTFVQRISPGVWYNAFVPYKDVTIKYGVMSVDDLCADLLHWRTLYAAGRMHKPIRIIRDDARVRLTQQVNLTSAVRTALLGLPAEFSQDELFARIAGISYRGDPRMVLPAENRGKVANIVRAQAPQFKELYHRLAVALPGVHWPMAATRVRQDASPLARAALARKLPATLRLRLEAHFSGLPGVPKRDEDESAFWTAICSDEARLQRVIDTEIASIVRGPALVQSVKGIASSGILKSIRYGAGKVGKWWGGA